MDNMKAPRDGTGYACPECGSEIYMEGKHAVIHKGRGIRKGNSYSYELVCSDPSCRFDKTIGDVWLSVYSKYGGSGPDTCPECGQRLNDGTDQIVCSNKNCSFDKTMGDLMGSYFSNKGITRFIKKDTD